MSVVHPEFPVCSMCVKQVTRAASFAARSPRWDGNLTPNQNRGSMRHVGLCKPCLQKLLRELS